MEKIKIKLNEIQMYLDKNITNYIMIFFIILSFWLPDLFLRYMIYKSPEQFSNWYNIGPNFLTISYIFSFIVIYKMISPKNKKKLFTISSLISDILFVAQYIHFRVFNRFLGFSDILLSKEGKDFATDMFTLVSKKFIVSFLIIVFIQIITYAIINKTVKNEMMNYRKITVYLLIIGIFRMIAILSFGNASVSDSFDAALNPKNIYISYSENNKSLQVSGMYDHLFRSFTIFIEKQYLRDFTEIKNEVDYYFKNREPRTNKNEFTGKFKDKNLIYILLESIDDWIVTEETMPTLYMMKETGWDFPNRFASSYGGGWTFNTEFAANTGYYSIPNYKAAFTFSNNDFRYSLPNLFINDGYDTNSMHANYGHYYNRKIIHESIGFQKHYALKDNDIIHNVEDVYDDSILLDDDSIYSKFVNKNERFFMHFSTFTAHAPYDESNIHCKDKEIRNLKTGDLECYKILSNKTDIFLNKLINRLKKDNLLEETIIILYGDHYPYAYQPKEYIHNIKGTNETNLLQKTPFIIWNPKLEAKTFQQAFSTVDFVPTIANLFGLKTYNPNNYISYDIFSKEHKNIVTFSDDSWFDGINYSKDISKDIDEEYIDKINKEVINYNKINELILISDYFNK